MMFERKEVLEFIRKFKDKRLIKVVTGIRRCGKSTILEMLRADIAREQPDANLIVLDFERAENAAISTSDALYGKVVSLLRPMCKNYVFLDEIQHVDHFEKAVDGLFARGDADLYVTGSNSRLLSGEIATLLSGRYVEVHLQPLSFAEIASAARKADSGEDLRTLWNRYVRFGGFPYAQEFVHDDLAVDTYLEGLFNTIVVKDVVQRRKIADAASLERIVRFLFDNIGNVTTIKAICDALSSGGRKLAPQTVDSYIEGLCDAFVILRADRYDIRGRDLLKTGQKYYASDMGLRRHVLGGAFRDYGRVLENLVYLELVRRFAHVRVGTLGSLEVDFVSGDEGSRAYWQVAASVRDEVTLERELRPLRELRDNYPKWIITLDDDPPMDYDGIRQISALDFFLGRF